jgi:hypothetical protein
VRALLAAVAIAAAATCAGTVGAQPYVAGGIAVSQGEVAGALSAGIQLSRLALEAGAVRLDQAEGSRVLAILAFPTTDDGVTFSARLGAYRLAERSQVGPCIRADRSLPCNPPRQTVTVKDTALAYGLGAEYRMTRLLGFRVTFDFIDSDLPSGSLTAGAVEVVLRF